MSPQDSVIRLLIAEDQLEDAEQLISILRNGGMAVRPQRPESEQELQSILAAQAIDLVLASETCKLLPLPVVVGAVTASGKDIAVVVTAARLDVDATMEATKAGARAIALRTRPEHLQMVVREEFSVLEQRRAIRRLEAALRETERRCDALISSSRDPIAYVHEGMHIRANRAYLEMFGYESFEEVEGLPVLDMIAGTHANEFKILLKELSRGGQPPKALELEAQRSDGSTFDAIMEFAQASYEGEPCLQIIFRQQVIDPDVVKELDALASRDQATGLLNRQHFMGSLDEAVAAAAAGSNEQALFLIELDNYANLLNDIGLSHADEMLVLAARRLESQLSEGALAARFSDHSFAVLCQGNHTQTRAQAERVRAGFQDHIFEVGERSLSLSVSIGGVQIGEKIASVQQVLGKASTCLQSALGEGGNRIELFDPAARDRAEEERIKQWVARIEHALKAGDFMLHFQPIISLHGEEGEVYEALLRMKVGNGDLVPPLTFLPIAEEHGLMDDIDRWVINRAIAVLAARQKSGRSTTLFVKITAYSLQTDGLPEWIGEQLKAHGVPGERLVLEIPEAKVFTNLKAAQEFQQRVAKFGCALCLEQFGSGLNSFQLLKHVDAGYLKIDRNFMSDLGKNAENQKKIREIAEQARASGKRTIAEFVQDAASMTVLFTSSVDYVEGNFLAPATSEMTYEFGH